MAKKDASAATSSDVSSASPNVSRISLEIVVLAAAQILTAELHRPDPPGIEVGKAQKLEAKVKRAVSIGIALVTETQSQLEAADQPSAPPAAAPSAPAPTQPQPPQSSAGSTTGNSSSTGTTAATVGTSADQTS